MTVKIDILGGTDWSDGDVLDGDDLTDTFDAVARLNVDIDVGTLSSSSTTTAETWTTVETLDLSSYNCVAVGIDVIAIVEGIDGQSGTGYVRVRATHDDDTTADVVSVSKNTSSAQDYYNRLVTEYQAPAGKTIKNLLFQAYVSDNTDVSKAGFYADNGINDWDTSANNVTHCSKVYVFYYP
jgi:hypothetical protein